eukprot:49181_1
MSCKQNQHHLAELTVYGFIRTQCSKKQEMPTVLKEICVSMYLIIHDKWSPNTSHSAFDINDNSNVLKVKKENNTSDWINAFGKLIVRKGEIQTWNIRIMNGNFSDHESRANRVVMFGIIEMQSISHNSLNTNFFCNYDMHDIHSYAYYSFDGDSFHCQKGRTDYGEKWDKDDLITMTLDMTETDNKKFGILSFKKNGIYQGIFANDIDMNREYCMALSIVYEDEIELCQDELTDD